MKIKKVTIMSLNSGVGQVQIMETMIERCIDDFLILSTTNIYNFSRLINVVVSYRYLHQQYIY